MPILVPSFSAASARRWSASCSGLPSLRIKGSTWRWRRCGAVLHRLVPDQGAWFTEQQFVGRHHGAADEIFGVRLTPQEKYLLVLTIVAVMALMAKNMVRFTVGRAWMAVRDMDVAAEVIGIRIMRTKLTAFAVSSFYCGVAGALYAFCLPRHGGTRYQPRPLVPHLFMVIIGGVGSVLGPSFWGSLYRCSADRFRRCVSSTRCWPAPTTVIAPGTDGVRRAHHLLPDRRAARAGPVVADPKKSCVCGRSPLGTAQSHFAATQRRFLRPIWDMKFKLTCG